MRYRIMLSIVALLFSCQTVFAQDVAGLAECVTKVFKEVGRGGRWSGKPPAGCKARVSLEKRPAGLFVTAWIIENAEGGWVRTALSGAMSYGEIASKKELARASRDIVARAGRLERCLVSINNVNDPLECRDRAVRSYLAGEETGIENRRLVWLDDDGRHTVVEYAFGNTSSTPSPPVDLFKSDLLPPGIILDLHPRGLKKNQP